MALGQYKRTTPKGTRRDNFGNELKNVFCYETESKNGTIGYKGYFAVNNRNYSIYFKFQPTARTDGKNGNWVTITELK